MTAPGRRGWGAVAVVVLAVFVALLEAYVALILLVGAYENVVEFSDPVSASICLALALATPAAVMFDRRVCRRRGQPLSVSRSTAIGFGVVVVVTGVVGMLQAPF